MPSFTSRSLNRRQPLFFQYVGGKAVRDGKWKLVRSGSGPWELYDSSHDRTETTNLASDYPPRLSQMEEAWHQWNQDCTGPAKASKKKR